MKVLTTMKRIENAMTEAFVSNRAADGYGVIPYYDGHTTDSVKYEFNYTNNFSTAQAQAKARKAVRNFVAQHGGKITTPEKCVYICAEFPIVEEA